MPTSPVAPPRRPVTTRRAPARAARALGALALVLLAACGDKDSDSGGATGGSSTGSPSLDIVSPRSGDFYDEGDTVLLDVEARSGDSAAAEPTGLRWSLVDGDWSASGDNLSVTDLPPGVWTLQADAAVDGQPLQASVELIVYAASR